jgi:carbon monoxide dehydrogenase subunit G
MAIELHHTFTTEKPLDESWASILDLDHVVSSVEGGRVVESTGPTSAKAEIKVKMGAMSLSYNGTVDVLEQDDAARRAVMRVKSREVGGQGFANATVVFTLADGGGTIDTTAQVTGKAASMGEGVIVGVLDALIADFATKIGN